MPTPPPLVHARWITAGVCAGAVAATGAIAGGLAVSGDSHAATTSTVTTPTAGTTAPTMSSSPDTGDNDGSGWTPTAPAQTTESAPHAHTGAS